MHRHISSHALLTSILLFVGVGAAETSNRVTILFDAFGKNPALTMDCGYAALVEYGGKRILFDAGSDPDILARNVAAKNVDLSKLDFVVISHRHGDHMGGLSYLLKVNPEVTIYAPKERSGVFGDDVPSSKWYRKDTSLPAEQRYYNGSPPEIIHMGSAWPGAHFRLIDKDAEIAPGMQLIALVSDRPGTLELHELSLAIRTPDGLVLLVGCSHPGLEKILQAAAAVDPHIHFLAGGFHLVIATDPEIDKIVTTLRDTYKVEYVAPGHCTGEPAFTALKKAFGDHYLYAGLGTTLTLSGASRSLP